MMHVGGMVAQEVVTCGCVVLLLFINELQSVVAWDRLAPGDSGELVAAAASLVPPHPPGYPLFVWVYHVAIRLGQLAPMHPPIPPTASCTAATVALSLLGWSLLSAAAVRIPAKLSFLECVASRTAFVFLCWSCSPASVRDVTTQTEVFALQWLLCAVLTRVVMGTGSATQYGIVVAVGALCLASQHTSVFAVAPLSIFFLFHSGLGIWRAALGVAAGSALVLTLYATLMWMHTDDLYAWGDLTNVFAVAHHALRSEYGTLQLHSGRGVERHAAPSPWQRWVSTNKVFFLWCTEVRTWQSLLLAVMIIAGLVTAARPAVGLRGPSVIASLAVWWLLGGVACFNWMINLPLDGPEIAALTQALHYHVVGRLWAHLWMPTVLVAAGGVRWALSLLPDSPRRRFPFVTAMCVLAVSMFGRRVDIVRGDEQMLHSVADAYGSAMLQWVPNRSVLITVGDQPLTAVRHAQRARGKRDDVVHIDREISSYDWFQDRLHHHPVHSRRVRWPPRRQGQLFVPLLDIAQHNVGVEEARNSRRLFVMEDRHMTSEVPNVKDAFTMMFGDSGWLYEVVPKAQASPAHAICIDGSVDWMPRGLRCFECLLRNANTSWRWNSVESSCHPLPATIHTGAPDVPILQADIRDVAARGYPWAAIALQQYHLAIKHSLLQAADSSQRYCPNRTAFRAAMQVIRSEAHRRLLPRYFADQATYDMVVVPFVSLLEKVWKELL